MNYLIFNTNAANLKATVYGMDNNQVKPVAVDSNGYFVLSPLGAVTVTATNLDIRDLNSATDSVTVTATDLDIRNLSGTQDSVQLYNCGFVEDTLSTTVASGTSFLLVKDISAYRQNSYYLKNNGSNSVTIAMQLSPVNTSSYFVDDASTATVTAGGGGIVAATVAMKFARLRVTASASTAVEVYYNGRA